MRLSRRAFLAQGTAALASGCAPHLRSESLPPGQRTGVELAERAHRLWRGGPPRPPSEPPERVDVAIVGGGVAGLMAAWRLARAERGLRVVVLELGDQLGGTAAWGQDPRRGAYPLGAHYLTLPSPEARHMRVLLRELGVIQGFDGAGRPVYDSAALCLAPQERLFVAGEWIHGLWPALLASPADERQRHAWGQETARWVARRGEDGLWAFSIPVALSSRDPDIRRLADLSFAAWLDQQGFDSPLLRWELEYGCLDDYGTSLEQTSAWAGLHYHCARRPDPGHARDLGTHVLTWPAGNGWLIQQLTRRAGAELITGALVRRVQADGELWFEQGDRSRGLRAERVILATSSRVADLLAPPRAERWPDFCPWRVAQIHVDELPAGRGVPVAWDSVVYDSESLGYVTSTHQSGRYGGPSVLTWYQPLWRGDPAVRRRELLFASRDDEARRVLEDLAACHTDLRARTRRIDIGRWGHGTVRPVVGLHGSGELDDLARSRGHLHYAHTDLSGLSLFEEASWHGVRAAEEVLVALGHPLVEVLAPGPAEAVAAGLWQDERGEPPRRER